MTEVKEKIKKEVENHAKKNVRQKLQEARILLRAKDIKPSGYNDFTKTAYFTLMDILPPITEVCGKLGLCPVFSYSADQTILTLFNTDGDDTLTCTSPQIETEVKISKAGKEISSKMQALAGNQTSQKRMLLLSTFDICSEDAEEKEIDISAHNIFEIKKRIEMKMTLLMQEGYDISKIIKALGLKDEKVYYQCINAITSINALENNLNVLINDKSKLEN